MTDEIKRKPANQNPWYVLMTVAGEQDFFEDKLHQRNRRYWNGWAAGALSDEDKAKLITEDRVPEADLAPLSDQELSEIKAALKERLGTDEIPAPGRGIAFKGTTFEKSLVCEGFLFPTYANFRSAAFSGYAYFQSATFSSYADFRSAAFSGDAFFLSAAFSEYANFQTATFSSYADFRSAAFSEGVRFDNAQFNATTKFKDAKFSTSPPAYFGAELHQETDWHGIKWPDVPKDSDAARHHRYAYEQLRLLMSDQKKHGDEHFFLRMELRCKEAEGSMRRFERIASKLFGAFADYGWSAGRPFRWLVGLCTFGAGAIYFCEDPNSLGRFMGANPADALGLGQAIAVSLSNVFPFLSLGRFFLGEELRSLTTASEVIAGVQLFFGPLFLFLILLALRNRFRLG
ncbi:MAG: pentapeptide repeat-containing protein [Pseudomonadota bacterium]